MPKKRIDWDAVLRAWITAKRQNSAITKSQFFRDQGITRQVGVKKISVKMDAMWLQVQEKAQHKIADDVGLDLAKEFREVFKKGKALFNTGHDYLVAAKDSDGEAAIAPEDATEAAKITSVGLNAMVDPARLITGGEPLITETVGKPRWEWIPSENKKGKRKAKKTKRS